MLLVLVKTPQVQRIKPGRNPITLGTMLKIAVPQNYQRVIGRIKLNGDELI